MGERFMERLKSMQAKHPTMGDVRGKGLMVGVELVKDKTSTEPATQLRDAVVQQCFESGLLMLGCGISSVRFVPALNVPAALVDQGLEIFEHVLSKAEEEV